MTVQSYLDAITLLNDSGKYRVIQKYEKPEYYHLDDGSEKLIGLFLDVETTGIDFKSDKIIELGIVVFEYSSDGKIFRIMDEFSQFQDPGMPIPEIIQKITGITDDMVKGKSIDVQALHKLIDSAQIIIAHNAEFDRKFVESFLPTLPRKPWGCSLRDINWRAQGIESHKQEYLAYKFGFYYEGHRATIDCLAGIHILSQKLPVSNSYALKELLETINQPSFKLWAVKSPFEKKDLLKNRRYRWHGEGQGKYKAWAIEIPNEVDLRNEINFLWSEVYGRVVKEPIDVFSAHNRFSILEDNSEALKQQREQQVAKIYDDLAVNWKKA